MIQREYYKKNDLLKLLGDKFHIICLDTIESYDCEDDSIFKRYYITNRNDIEQIKTYYSLWTTIYVQFKDGTQLKLHSNNVNSKDDTLLRITKNDFLSPPIIEKNEEYIKVTDNLREWLLYNGIKREQLNEITEKLNDYPTYIFSINTTKVTGGVHEYEREIIKITENKIDETLSDIKDTDMRINIEKILKSFRHEYE